MKRFVEDVGPLLLSESVTDPAPKVSATVPSPVQVTDTDQEVGPPEAEGVPQPAAVPLEVTSPAPMVASSLKMMLKLAVCEPTGDVGVDHAAVGPVASIVTVVAFYSHGRAGTKRSRHRTCGNTHDRGSVSRACQAHGINSAATSH